MKEILSSIKREKGFDYYVDKEGNVVKSSYNWFRDKTTLVVIALIILGGLYYVEMSNSKTNAKNFDSYCALYYPVRADFVLNKPTIVPSFELVMEYYEENKQRLDNLLKLPNG